MWLDAKMFCPLEADGAYLCKQAVMPTLYVAIALMAIRRSCPELDVQVRGNVLTKLHEKCLAVSLDGRLRKAIYCSPTFGLHQRM